jgi:hypothetical protein
LAGTGTPEKSSEEQMKRILGLVAFAVLYLPATANATVVTARFTFDDGSAVAGHVMLYQVATPADTLVGTFVLDGQGSVSSNIALDPTATYHAQLVTATGTVLQQVWTTSLPTAIASAILQMLPTGELDVVLAKADGSVKSAQFVQRALTETKFASCGSNPPAATQETQDAGGGLMIGYVVKGQTFDCQMNVPAEGTYPLNIRAESPVNYAKVHFEYPIGTRIGNEVTVTATIPNWSSPQAFQTFSAGSATLPQGAISIRIVVDRAGLNLDWFN